MRNRGCYLEKAFSGKAFSCKAERDSLKAFTEESTNGERPTRQNFRNICIFVMPLMDAFSWARRRRANRCQHFSRTGCTTAGPHPRDTPEAWGLSGTPTCARGLFLHRPTSVVATASLTSLSLRLESRAIPNLARSSSYRLTLVVAKVDQVHAVHGDHGGKKTTSWVETLVVIWVNLKQLSSCT